MRISRFSQMFLLLMVSGWGTVWAAPEKSLDASISRQSAKITTQGTIVDAQGEPLIGVSILEVGTTNGTITDIDGKFTLQVASGATLEISYIGYKTQQLTATPDFGTIKMSDDTEVLQEVVVTALGIKREKKALGYAIQEVKGESLVAARETNLANALSGKISGVQVIRSSNGPGGSSCELNRIRQPSLIRHELCRKQHNWWRYRQVDEGKSCKEVLYHMLFRTHG